MIIPIGVILGRRIFIEGFLPEEGPELIETVCRIQELVGIRKELQGWYFEPDKIFELGPEVALKD